MRNKKNNDLTHKRLTLKILEGKLFDYVERNMGDRSFYLLESNENQLLCGILKTSKFKITNNNGTFHHYEAIIEKPHLEIFILEILNKHLGKNAFDLIGCKKFIFENAKISDMNLNSIFNSVLSEF